MTKRENSCLATFCGQRDYLPFSQGYGAFSAIPLPNFSASDRLNFAETKPHRVLLWAESRVRGSSSATSFPIPHTFVLHNFPATSPVLYDGVESGPAEPGNCGLGRYPGSR